MDPTWSEARKKAYQNKETSPNQYYYRFNENPHEAKAGKWSKAEDELLIAQVREHGAKAMGDIVQVDSWKSRLHLQQAIP